MFLLSIESSMETFARVYSKNAEVKVVLGSAACTDGETIFVPPIPDQADPKLRFATEMLVYHETGHVKTKDFPAFKQYDSQKSKQFVFNIVRDVVVEHTMESIYSGMVEKWARFLTDTARDMTNPEMTNPKVSVGRKILLTLYFRCREAKSGKDFGLVLPKEIKELYDARLAKFVPEIVKASTIQESQELTERIYKAIKEDPPPQQEQNNGQSNSGKSSSGSSGKSQSGSAGKSDPQSPQKDLSADKEPDSGSPDGSSENNADGTDDQPGTGSDPFSDSDPTGSTSGSEDGKSSADQQAPDKNAASPDPVSDPGTQPDNGNQQGNNGNVTPELSDEAKEALKKARQDLDKGNTGQTITEQTADRINKWVGQHKLYREVAGLKDNVIIPLEWPGWEYEVNSSEERGRQMTGYIGRKMKTLFVSEKAPHWRTNLRTGKIDCRKLHKLSRGSLEVCKQKGEHTYEDSAVWLVLDHSGSMKGTKRNIAQALLTCLASDLDKLRIPFGAVGFTSYQEPINDEVRRSPCHLVLMKDFNEPYRVVRHRFAWPKSSSLTAEFPAIKFGAHKLAMRKETKRVLFILTDGSTKTGSAELDCAMRAAMKEYIRRLIKAGMKVVGVGILDNSLEKYIPDFIHVDDLSAFASQFYTKLSQLIL